MAWTPLGWIDMGEDREDYSEPECESVNQERNTLCARNWHEDDLHWHETDDGDPLLLLHVEWREEVVLDYDKEHEEYAYQR